MHFLGSNARNFRPFIRKSGCSQSSCPLAPTPFLLISALLLLAGISGCGRGAPNPSAACLRGGGGIYPVGNIQFQAVNIAVTNGMVNRYFNFQDYSNIGVQEMVFNATALSGASLVPPDGLMQAVGFNSVD